MDLRIIKANKKIAKILAREVVREVKKKEKEKVDFFKWQENAYKEEVKLEALRKRNQDFVDRIRLKEKQKEDLRMKKIRNQREKNRIINENILISIRKLYVQHNERKIVSKCRIKTVFKRKLLLPNMDAVRKRR
jgi:hypothetical protein